MAIYDFRESHRRRYPCKKKLIIYRRFRIQNSNWSKTPEGKKNREDIVTTQNHRNLR